MNTEMVATNGVARQENGEIVIRDPFTPEVFHNAENVGELIASANARYMERRMEFEALGELAKANIDAVWDLKQKIEKDDELLKKFDGELRDALLDMSGFLAYVVQTKGPGTRIDKLSVRGKLGDILKQLKERIDAGKVKAPPRTFVVVFEATDEGFNSIADYAKKKGSPFLRYATPQSDKAIKKQQEWFNDNAPVLG